MPAATTAPAALCSRCHTARSAHVVRKEPFCEGCFIRFLRGKQRRAMGDYKVTYPPGRGGRPLGPPPRVLLALSLSHASLALLDMLVSLVREQRVAHRGAAGLDLVVAHVDEGADDREARRVMADIASAHGDVCECRVVSLDEFYTRAAPSAIREFYHSASNIADYSFSPRTATNPPTVSSILARIPDRTACRDIIDSIRTHLILSTAAEATCTTVLWGDTMTRLAEKTLSMTAKGRGDALPRLLADGLRRTADGPELVHIYPLREVLRSEAETYASVCDMTPYLLSTNLAPASSVLRMMTIDDITRTYFRDIEAAFPSIVSTVVRTAAKLADPRVDGGRYCAICATPCVDAAPERWLTTITVSSALGAMAEEVAPATDAEASPDRPPLCYGCLVATKGASFAWPRIPSVQDVVDEYAL
ncbi:uncharacterized protein V1518DRAFT_419845 [Limtongia smithiae]|uniref:uncharacterized protein n=1 Tax=Limtongia smithiae TaxID=1125753 RepID=UPI0034CD307B